MTIVLIKLKWVHYNLNTRLCLNCILMSPNWLRWMLSLVVRTGETLSTVTGWWPGPWWMLHWIRWGSEKINADSLEIQLSVSVSEVMPVFPVSGVTTLVTRRLMGAGCGLGWSLSCPPHICYWPGRDQIQNVEKITIVWSEMITMMRVWHNWKLSRKLKLYFNASIESRV